MATARGRWQRAPPGSMGSFLAATSGCAGPGVLLVSSLPWYTARLGAVLPTLQRGRWGPLLPAAGWVSEEALRERVPFGGFPWGRWAFSQASSPLKWFAALGGAP